MKFVPPSEDYLREEYITKRKDMHEIARESGYAVGTIYNYMKKYGIKSRPTMTEETRIKIGLSNKGKIKNIGRIVSPETRAKISQTQKGRVYKPSKYGGHSRKRTDGYIKVYVPLHPHANKDGYVMEHILAMEKHIGRYLEKDEVVHHINHNRSDNRIENLQLMTFKEHARLHMNERWEKKRKEKAK